jgi:lysophospholipase L1-like esterase
MTTILCYGDSNTWGCMPMTGWGIPARFPAGTRWPGVMRTSLGPGFTVVEEGLNGRTTCLDDPIEGRHKNGEAFLPVALETHQPLDLVVVMLGTNDLKARFGMPPGDIALGAGRLARLVQQSTVGPDGRAPAVLLCCPAPVARLSLFSEMFEGAPETSRRLGPAMRGLALQLGIPLVDLGGIIRSSDVDGIHLDADQHRVLGEAMAERVRDVLGAKGE